MNKPLLIHSNDFVIKLSEKYSDQLFSFNTSSLVNDDNLPTHDSFCHTICLYLDEEKYKGTTFIILDKIHLKHFGWDLAIKIASHIRLHPFQNNSLNSISIILCHFDLPDLTSDKSLSILQQVIGFPTAKGFFFKEYSELFSETLDQNGEPRLALFSISSRFKMQIDLQGDLLRTSPSNFEVLSRQDDRHGIANEWGAYKLADSFNQKINYKLPNDLYFKFLKAKFLSPRIEDIPSNEAVSKPKTILPQKESILLIDDNASKGWKEALENILPAEVDTKECSNDVDLNKLSQYSLIFLDLRLPENKGDKPEISIAISLLSKIKAKYPYLPVIAFTASNKAWNYESLMDRGADGYFIKESPENAWDESFSNNNKQSLISTVENCIEKGKTLKPYWEGINEILSCFNTLVQNRSTINYNANYLNRIEERLQMFFGLLKRTYEDSTFNKTKFFYSDNELAFMTLWSSFNEISEAYYLKNSVTNLTIPNQNGTGINRHPNGSQITALNANDEKWQVRGQPDILFDSKYRFKEFDSNGNPKTNNSGSRFMIERYIESNLKYDKGGPIIYQIQLNDFNPNKTLHAQIAFLLLAKDQLKNNSQLPIYLNNLSRLNEVRNNLYLTHGENPTSGFYSLNEQDKRHNPNYNITPSGDIKDLFELVGFLLTARNVSVTF